MGHRPSYATYLGGCRCDGCRAAAIDSYKEKRKKEVESRALVQRTKTPHGTEKSYNLGCRCEKCEIAHDVREEVARRRTEQQQREEWVNRLTFVTPDENEEVEPEEEISDEELEVIAETPETERTLHFEDIL